MSSGTTSSRCEPTVDHRCAEDVKTRRIRRGGSVVFEPWRGWRYRWAMDQPEPVITDHSAATRYEAHVGTELAGFVQYRLLGGRRVLIHTEVLPGFAGRGIGAALARHVLDAAIASDLRVTVKCPFIRTYVERHPQYAAIAALPRRGSG
ncbi:MAG: GNAT family N-acetyltransferase [Chloroflexota bacterium]